MPTKRTRLPRHLLPDPRPGDAVIRYLLTGQYERDLPAGDNGREYWLAVWGDDLHEKWRLVGGELLAMWIKTKPGSRPWAWWTFDAPREPLRLCADRSWNDADRARAHRRRVGGVGDPQHEVMGCAIVFGFGVPMLWVDPWMVSAFPQSAPDLYTPGWARAIDPDDPPRFESEAAYLERHGLLTDAERRRLPAGAFEPEKVNIEDDDDAD